MKQKSDNKTADLEDVFVWPDGTWCYRYETDEMSHKSNDYIVIHFDEAKYQQFFEEEVKELKKIVTGV